jgi:hypothetical protein
MSGVVNTDSPTRCSESQAAVGGKKAGPFHHGPVNGVTVAFHQESGIKEGIARIVGTPLVRHQEEHRGGHRGAEAPTPSHLDTASSVSWVGCANLSGRGRSVTVLKVIQPSPQRWPLFLTTTAEVTFADGFLRRNARTGNRFAG